MYLLMVKWLINQDSMYYHTDSKNYNPPATSKANPPMLLHTLKLAEDVHPDDSTMGTIGILEVWWFLEMDVYTPKSSFVSIFLVIKQPPVIAYYPFVDH